MRKKRVISSHDGKRKITISKEYWIRFMKHIYQPKYQLFSSC